MPDDILLLDRDGPVAILTLNRPKTRNALSLPLIAALGKAIKAVADDASARAIVITGAGGAFCSGADLKAAMSEGDMFDRLDPILDDYHAIIRGIARAPKPVIAMVEGGAVGFGCDLALACDLRFASPDAYFQEKFVKIGLMPDGGGTFWLPRLVGLGRAMELALTGEPLDAERALGLGLVNRIVPSASLREETLTFAHRLAKGPPLALASIKQAMRESLGGTIDAALDREKVGQIRLLKSNDCFEGIAAWMQKREPDFQGK